MIDLRKKKLSKLSINNHYYIVLMSLKNRLKFKRILKKEFKFDALNSILKFKSQINNDKDFKKINLLCSHFDCRFKMIDNKTISLYF